MEDTQEEQFDRLSGQIIVYYPFRYKESNEVKAKDDKKINTTKISIDDGIEIYHDDFIKLVDTENSEKDFGREMYTVALGPIDELSNKIYQPKFENEGNETINKFTKMLENTMLERPTYPDAPIEEKGNKKEIILPQILKSNVVLYKKTRIGIFELFLSYTFDKNKDHEEAASQIADIAGKLKKLFFIDDNGFEYSKRKPEKLIKSVKHNTETFVEFINKLKGLDIKVEAKDILFNCIEGKKRAYSFCQLYVNQEDYCNQIKNKKNVNPNIDPENNILLCLGRAHSQDGRDFTIEVAERFKYEDENSCKFCITASSFGTLILCNIMKNYVYYMQHMQEQFSFVYELCLHQRFYLYTVIEEYRKTDQNYYAIKSNFAEMITRYNMSLISEVEPQAVYTRIRNAMNIEAITKDAEKALDLLQAKEEKKKSLETEKFSRLLSILGLVMTALNIITFVTESNTINFTKLLIALFILGVGIWAWKRPYSKK